MKKYLKQNINFSSRKRICLNGVKKRRKPVFPNEYKKSFLEYYEDFLASGTPLAKITPTLLAIIALPGFLAVSALLPGLVKMYAIKNALNKNSGKVRCYKAISRVKKSGLIKIMKKDNEMVYVLSKNGENIFYWDLFKEIKPPSIFKQHWDKKWRIVIFDFPIEYNFRRDILRKKLQEWNFQQLQKSVFISPLSCFKELRLLRDVLNAHEHIFLLEASFIENEKKWKEYFRIRK